MANDFENWSGLMGDLERTYKQTQIALLLLSLMQIYFSGYYIIFSSEASIMLIISEIGFLIQNLFVFVVVFVEMYYKSRWYHKLYRLATYISIIGMSIVAALFMSQGFTWNMTVIRLLLSITNTIIMMRSYHTFHKE